MKIKWPDIHFGPVNLWVLPSASYFYRDKTESKSLKASQKPVKGHRGYYKSEFNRCTEKIYMYADNNRKYF